MNKMMPFSVEQKEAIRVVLAEHIKLNDPIYDDSYFVEHVISELEAITKGSETK